jgi:hypothetical protein
MKKLKPVIICLVIALIVFQQIVKGKYYSNLFSNNLSGNYGLLSALLQSVWAFLIDVFIVVLGFIALLNADLNIKDRAYSMLRFVYVMSGIMHFPVVVMSFAISGAQMFTQPVNVLLYLLPNLIWAALVVLFMVCKPDRQIARVNLQDFDMVAYTSTGHRFVHYLLDHLLMLPAWISTISYIYFLFYVTHIDITSYSPLLIQAGLFFYFIITYIMYYFLSESIFRQTLGKMVTRSCVVGNGPALTTGRVLQRSFCRLIPFDAIAFLFGANWHDSASATSVVYVDSWEKAFGAADVKE